MHARAGRAIPALFAVGRRQLCAATACPWTVLGLSAGAPPRDIKARYYELAKQMHPDANQAEDAQEAFVGLLEAFELAMAFEVSSGGASSSTTSASSAARGAHGSAARSTGHRPATKPGERVATLGEVLCERLRDEPAAAREVWADIVDRGLEVRESMLEALFRACGARGGGGLTQALLILREARQRDLLTAATRSAAAIFVIKWCKEDRDSFGRIMGELDAEDAASAEVRETLSYANALYSGLSDGYSA